MINYLIMDIDGSLTDGKIYMGPAGELTKAFSIKDGYAMNYILKPANIRPVIITARSSSIVQNRCDELGIKDVYQGALDKLTVLKELCNGRFEECAYFGDDIIDLRCMNKIKNAGGFVGCPADAVQEVKAVSDYVCINKAGEGALREFAEWLVKPHTDESALEKRINSAIDYIKGLDIKGIPVNEKIIVDEGFFYSVQNYTTKSEDKCKLESHRKYVDIQFMVLGSERMDISDISRLSIKENYNPDKDVMFWNAPKHIATVTLNAGDIIVLYPENAHRGAISTSNCSNVVKIVGKVLIEI